MEKLLTVKQAADLLSTSAKNLYRLISERKIPFIRRPGIGYRFKHSHLEHWLQEGYEPPSGWKDSI